MCTVCFRATSAVPVKPGRGADADWLPRALWLLLLCERWQQQPCRDSVTAGWFIADARLKAALRQPGRGVCRRSSSDSTFFSLQHLNASPGSPLDNNANVNAIIWLVWLS